MSKLILIKRKTFPRILFFLAIAISGIIYVRYTWIQFENEQSEKVLQIARSIEATLPKEELKLLEAKPSDIDKPAYQLIKNTLKEIIRVNHEARFSYIYAEQNGKIYFLADSEPVESPDYSPPGQEYLEAKPQDKKPFIDGKELITAPITDRWGIWISVFIPIKDKITGKTMAVFGMDFSAKSWNKILLFEVSESTVLIVLLLFAFFFIFHIKDKNELLRTEITNHKLAQEALHASEEKYRPMFFDSPQPMWIYDLDTLSFLEVNKAAMGSYGYTREEFLLMTLKDIRPNEDISALLKYIELTVQSFNRAGEWRHLKKNGELMFVEITSHIVTFNGRDARHVLINDITKRKIAEQEIHDLNVNLEHKIAQRTAQLAESNAKLEQEIGEQLKISKALIESENRFSLFMDFLPALVFIKDSESKMVYANKAMNDALGASEWIGLSASEIFGSEEALRINEDDKKTTETGYQKIEEHFFNLDGILHCYETQKFAIQIAGQNPMIGGIAIDISERRQAEIELEHVSTRLELAVYAGGVGVWDYDIVNNILVWDDQMFALYGIEKKDFTGAYDSWQSGLLPEDKERGDVEIQMAIRGEKEFDTEFRVIWPNGSIHNIRARAIVEHDSSGKPLNLIGTNWDITDQKQAEKALITARNEANKANLSKSEFLSRMSHELRTPLNSILGFTQLMEMGELKASHKKWVNNIRSSGKHLLSLINEVLELAGIESGKQILTLKPVQISGILSEISDVVQILADKINVKIVLVDSPASKIFIIADKLRLKQVLLNLTSNAIKYNREGGSVSIKTALQPTDAHGNATVRISISDTGNGIKPEDITKLFHAFGRLGADKSETEGTGLGLILVKELMKAMNGTVGVESQPGVGSTFWIELPLAENMKSDKQQNEENIKLPADSAIASIEHDLQSGNELLTFSADPKKAGTILYI